MIKLSPGQNIEHRCVHHKHLYVLKENQNYCITCPVKCQLYEKRFDQSNSFQEEHNKKTLTHKFHERRFFFLMMFFFY